MATAKKEGNARQNKNPGTSFASYDTREGEGNARGRKSTLFPTSLSGEEREREKRFRWTRRFPVGSAFHLFARGRGSRIFFFLFKRNEKKKELVYFLVSDHDRRRINSSTKFSRESTIGTRLTRNVRTRTFSAVFEQIMELCTAKRACVFLLFRAESPTAHRRGFCISVPLVDRGYGDHHLGLSARTMDAEGSAASSRPHF